MVTIQYIVITLVLIILRAPFKKPHTDDLTKHAVSNSPIKRNQLFIIGKFKSNHNSRQFLLEKYIDSSTKSEEK